jgi:DNA-binding response OmpR family regulator
MPRRILIVEDDPKIREELKLSFLMRGYEVFEANNGLFGLELARSKKPQLILQDLMISKIDGFRSTRLLKFDERYKDVVVIAITQLAREEAKEEAKRVGFDHFFIKPLDPETTADKVDAILKEKGL